MLGDSCVNETLDLLFGGDVDGVESVVTGVPDVPCSVPHIYD